MSQDKQLEGFSPELVKEALKDSIGDNRDSIQKEMDHMAERDAAVVSESDITNIKTEKPEQKEKMVISGDDEMDALLSSVDTSEFEPAKPSSSNQPAWMGTDEGAGDDAIDMEAIEMMEEMLNQQKQGLMLTRYIITDSYYNINDTDAFNEFTKTATNLKDTINLLAVDASNEDTLYRVSTHMKKNTSCFGAIAYGPKSLVAGKVPNVEKLREIINKNRKFIAIGEAALDLHYSPSTVKQQSQLFLEQARLASELDKPLYINSKKADAEIYSLLNQLRDEGKKVEGIVVPVVRSLDMFRMILDHSFHILLRPEVTYENEDLYRECLKEVPIERLLLSSGDELTPPSKMIGRFNSPAYIEETIKYACEFFGMERLDFLRQMAENFNRIFNSDPEAADDEFYFTPSSTDPSLVMTEEKLLENDIDEDGDELFINDYEDERTIGNVYFDRENKLFVYTPKPGFLGADKFIYSVTDGRGGFDKATVTIHVSAPRSQ